MLVALALLEGCADRSHRDDDWPRGASIVARREALDRLFTLLTRFEGTPLARFAAERKNALPECPNLEGRNEGGDLSAAFADLGCGSGAGPLSPLHAGLAENDIVFALPLASSRESPDAPRLRGEARVEPSGAIALRIALPKGSISGPISLLIPGDTAPGPSLLSRREELVHARIRPDRTLDIASLIPDGGQADRLFRLKSALFAGAFLEGSWEVAVYLPRRDHRTPRVALSLGVKSQAAASAAMEGFVDELRRSWPIHRTSFAVGAARGACLLDLRILPEFAPCFVATGQALVAGWNPDSVRHALSGGASPGLGENGELVLELGRFGRADALFAEAAGLDAKNATPDSGPARYRAADIPWSRVVATRTGSGKHIEIDFRFESGAGT